MNPDVLAGLLKRVYNTFDMMIFDDRLKLQKYIYLLQSYGLNLGYRFSLYLRGPYCTELTKDGFQIGIFKEKPPVSFSDIEADKKFTQFIEFFKKHKDDTEWLEIASTILIYREIMPTEKKEGIIEIVNKKHSLLRTQKAKINDVWDELKKEGFIND